MRYCLFFFLLLLLSCNKGSKKEKAVRIEGSAVGQPDGMLYLVDAANWKSVIDSAACRSGQFQFLLPADTGFIPRAVAIHFYPGGDRLHPVRLQFQNPVLAGMQRDHFWMEPGLIRLEGKNHPDSLLQIKAGPETELMMRHQLDDIGWMGDQDSLIRKKKMAALEKEIRLHPQSFFLFESIRRSKELYGKEELAELLNLFDPRVLQSVPGKNLQSYLSSLPAAGSPYPLLHLPDTENRRLPLYDTRRQLNMLVFWASWCKPCRMEIPVLKKLNQQYAAKGLAITSISIDLDQDRWRLALAKEQMGWRQLVIPADSIEKIENIFRFTTIPFLVFTDERGVEIARFADDDENAFSRYEKIIRARLE